MRAVFLNIGLMLYLVRAAFGQTEVAPGQAEVGAPPSQQTVTMDIDAEALELRDPFKRPFTVSVTPGMPLGPLESFSVEEFKMVGSIVGTDRVKAILLDPTGKTHIVSERMKIGLKQGVIREIRTNHVKVREKVINAIGREELIDTDIKMISKSQAGRTAGGEF